MNEKLENIPEILLVSTDEYDKPINNPRKIDSYSIDILKFLVCLVFSLTVIDFFN